MQLNCHSAYSDAYGFLPSTITTGAEVTFQPTYTYELAQFTSTPSRKYYSSSGMNQNANNELHYPHPSCTSTKAGQSQHDLAWYSNQQQHYHHYPHRSQPYVENREMLEIRCHNESITYLPRNEERCLQLESRLGGNPVGSHMAGTDRKWSTSSDEKQITTGLETKLMRTAKRSCRRDHHREQDKHRTQSLNLAFCRLRDCLPQIPSDTKLTKIRTLRCAITYIRQLMHLVGEPTQDGSASTTAYRSEIDHHQLISPLHSFTGYPQPVTSYEGVHSRSHFEYQFTSNDSVLSINKESGYDSMLEK